MKKITLLLMLFVGLMSYGQIWTIASCSDLGSNTYGPTYSTATANSTNRTAVIYPSSQLTGIAGQVLNAAYFKRVTTTGAMAGTPNLKIYLKETTSTSWGTGALDWVTGTTGATLVYDSNPVSAVGSSAGWKSFAFSNTFTYSGAQNLAVFFEYTNATASATITWNYEYTDPCISTSNSNTTKYSNNTSGTMPTSLGSSDYRRPLIAFDFNVSCNAPTGLSSASVTSTSATINWNAPTIVPSEGYEYYLSTSSTAPLPSAIPTGSVAAGVTTKSFTGLPTATPHYVWVRSNCGTGDKSIWAQVSFTTACGVNIPTYLQDYNGTTFPPLCWTTAADGDPTTGPVGTAAGIWAADGFLNDGTIGAARVNLYSLNRKGWLISPPIDMSAGGYRVKFDVGVTAFTGSGPAQIVSDDKVVFLVSQDNGATWTILTTWDSTNSPSNLGTIYSANLASYVSPNTKFAFYATDGPIDDAPDYNFYVDNFLVEAIPSCEAPINIVASGITNATATISWDAVVGSTGYEYVLDQVATNPIGAGTAISAAPHNAASLAGNTVYYFHVRNNCGGSGFSLWTTKSFRTLPNPPANDDCFAAVTLTVNPNLACGVKTSGTLLGATDSGEGDNGIGLPNDDVWYKFVATAASHQITISNVAGTPTDLVHEVLDGTCGGGLFSVLLSDPNTSNVTGLVPGTTYYVRVFSLGTATGATTTFDLCIGTFPPPPANDNCSGAIALTVNADLACGVKTSGTLQSATDSGVPDNGVGLPNDDVWYTFVATTGSHTIALSNVAGTPTDLVHELMVGTCTGLVSLNVSDPNTSTYTGLTPGTTYYVRIFSAATGTDASTTFDVCIGSSAAAAVPANNEPSGAVNLTVNPALTCTATQAGTTISATASAVPAPACNANGFNDDVWYTFTATDVRARFTFSGTATGAIMATTLYTGTPGALVEVTGSCIEGNIQNFANLTVGTLYYARVFTNSASPIVTSAFTLCVGTPPAPPVNDDCANATLLTPGTTLTCTSPVSGTTVGATQSLVGCLGTADDDVWYKFVATSTTHSIITANATGSGTADIVTQVFDSCGGTSIVCQDSPNSPVNLTALTVGNTYFFRIYSYAVTTTTSFTVCVGTPPPPPANDNCVNAVVLTPGALFATNPVIGTNVSATNSNPPAPGCASFSGGDVWYQITVPASGSITIETNSNPGGTIADTGLAVYSGTCAALTLVECDDDDSADGNFSKVVLSGRTPGEVLYASVWEYGNDTFGTFKVAAYDASLSAPSFDDANFRAYPNPVVDVLNLSYTQEISNVSVFNLLGQQVISKTIGATDASVDMSNLAGGTYLVKVAVDNQVKTIKVIKK